MASTPPPLPRAPRPPGSPGAPGSLGSLPPLPCSPGPAAQRQSMIDAGPAPHLPLLRRLGYVPPPVRPLDIGELAALGALPLRARRLADALGAGGHKSRRKGASVEFADYRDYQPGDELRRVDWRLYARTDRLHIRETHEETPLRVVLLLDVSPSMAYASRPGLLSKLDYARMLLGAVALLARRQRDAVGLGLLSAELAEWRPPSSSPLRRQLLWSLLDQPPAGAGTDLPTALHQALDLAPRRCLFVLASDFYDEPERLAPAFRRLRYERHDLLALHLADPAEVDFAFDDPSVFFDLETGSQLALDPAAAAAAYRARFSTHRAALGEQLASQGLEHLFLRTDTLPVDALREHLAARAGR
jgi:uncharacterized protein (DUF58 family)